ncbi:bestrophin-like domain [Paraburkholderia tropica]|uniref:DUF4239 domain-containing protein n=1 Tax=Paraburkholderia tropica TaxID=92647 RepID=A0AAQ1GL71_9BURK|nr:DUF4239 domain-containing protein [Paraburkholderia tropica]RQN40737.1 DUF4239 domain-containing protein [Paraburkholderia tropica]SEK09127.1 Protein of unknown function [Paraburkholderia tropica]
MTELGYAALVFVLLLGGTGLGVLLKPLLPEEHRKHETVQLVQLVVGMLVTFAALVLSLLTASAKTSYDTATDDMRAYAADLIQLDSRLRDYGDGADAARNALRVYTAAAIASTWPQESAPPGDYYPRVPGARDGELESTQLGAMLNTVGHQIALFDPHDRYQAALATRLVDLFGRVRDTRWRLIEEAHGTISRPFFAMLTLWLMLIFLSFGLVAPHNSLAAVMIVLGAVSISSSVYVIVDLDTPFTGQIIIASDAMRDALRHMNVPRDPGVLLPRAQ